MVLSDNRCSPVIPVIPPHIRVLDMRTPKFRKYSQESFSQQPYFPYHFQSYFSMIILEDPGMQFHASQPREKTGGLDGIESLHAKRPNSQTYITRAVDGGRSFSNQP